MSGAFTRQSRRVETNQFIQPFTTKKYTLEETDKPIPSTGEVLHETGVQTHTDQKLGQGHIRGDLGVHLAHQPRFENQKDLQEAVVEGRREHDLSEAARGFQANMNQIKQNVLPYNPVDQGMFNRGTAPTNMPGYEFMMRKFLKDSHTRKKEFQKLGMAMRSKFAVDDLDELNDELMANKSGYESRSPFNLRSAEIRRHLRIRSQQPIEIERVERSALQDLEQQQAKMARRVFTAYNSYKYPNLIENPGPAVNTYRRNPRRGQLSHVLQNVQGGRVQRPTRANTTAQA